VYHPNLFDGQVLICFNHLLNIVYGINPHVNLITTPSNHHSFNPHGTLGATIDSWPQLVWIFTMSARRRPAKRRKEKRRSGEASDTLIFSVFFGS